MSTVPTAWRKLLTAKTIARHITETASTLDSQLEGKDVVLAIILKGAAYYGVDLSRAMATPHAMYFIEASSYKDKETQQEELEILSVIHPNKFEGKHVVLLDELYDNGFTMTKVKEAILKKVPSLTEKDITTCVMFCKDKFTKYPKPDIIGHVIPDVWVVGYGLDDKQKMRNLRDLWAKPKESSTLTKDDEIVFGDKDTYLELYNNINL